MRKQLILWARALALALVVAVGPLTLADAALSGYARERGKAELTGMAQQYVLRAEAAVDEAVAAMRGLAAAGATDCIQASRQGFETAVYSGAFLRQIGVVDATGTVLCAEPAGAAAAAIQLPAAGPDDASILLGITDGSAVVALRVDPNRRLMTRLAPSALSIEPGARYLADHHAVAVFLDDGSQWLASGAGGVLSGDTAETTVGARSQRYPIHTVVRAPTEALQLVVRPLRILVFAAAALVSFLFIVATLWITWQRGHTTDAISRAIRRREFVPYYQPVMDIGTGRVRGCEMLARWIKPDGTVVDPGGFMPYAEASGHIFAITLQLLKAVADDLGDLCADRPDLKVSLNLFAGHFDDTRIVDQVRTTFTDSGVALSQVVVEVTERMPLKDVDRARRTIAGLQAIGVRVALDDVGTGHGGLAYLQRLGIDIIKIDKMFIDQIGTDRNASKIVDSLVELGTVLGMGIVAEGVETLEQVDYLRRIGVTAAQGYLFAPPLPISAFRELVQTLGPPVRDGTETDSAVAA